MKARYKFVFNRKKILNKEGKALIQLQAYLNAKQKYFSTNIYIKSEQWDVGRRCIVKHPNQIRLNKQLRDLMSDVEDHEMRIREGGRPFSLEHLEGFLAGDSSSDFIAFCRSSIEGDNSMTYSSFRVLESKLNVIEAYGRFNNFDCVNYNAIEHFDRWLRSGGRKDKTIFDYHSLLKQFIALAIKKDLFPIQNNPYLKYTLRRPKEAKRKFLSMDQINTLRSKDLKLARLDRVRDVFLFSVYTGMSYVDIQNLKRADIYTDSVGEMWIMRDRVKTENEYKVPLLPQAAAVINKYDGLGKLLPVITNGVTNNYLKEIATLCEIEENLTFHMARHTFATTITLSNNVPIETVSKMLGHSDLKTTQIYAKVVDEKMKKDMDALRKKMEE